MKKSVTLSVLMAALAWLCSTDAHALEVFDPQKHTAEEYVGIWRARNPGAVGGLVAIEIKYDCPSEPPSDGDIGVSTPCYPNHWLISMAFADGSVAAVNVRDTARLGVARDMFWFNWGNGVYTFERDLQANNAVNVYWGENGQLGSDAFGRTHMAPEFPVCGGIGPGDGLMVMQALRSCDGRFSLIMQGDGNLVLYGPSGALWHSGTRGRRVSFMTMQGDGNVVLRNDRHDWVWDTETHSNAGAWLWLQDDGNLVVYAADGRVLWASGTNGHH